MENSPLIYLDNDVSQMLADKVRESQEEAARGFHLNILVVTNELPYDTRVLKGTIHRILNGLGRYWSDFWDEELSGKTTKSSISRRIILYEQELKNIMDGRRRYLYS